MSHHNIIELNGKRYDALTGALLGDGHTQVAVKLVSAQAQARGRVIDGIVRPEKVAKMAKAAAHLHTPAAPSKNHVTVTVKKPATIKAPESPIIKAAKPVHPAAKDVKAHRPEHASTLMRHVIEKPKVTMKPKVKVQVAAELAAHPQHAVTAKHSAYQVDARRLARSQAVARHTAIQHFAHAQLATTAFPIVEPAPVPAVHHAVPAPIHHEGVPHHHTPHRDIFEAAIAHATSHEQPKHRDPKRAKKRRLVNVTAVIAAFLVIGGFIGYLNMPNIELRVASIQAGFGAQLPGYTPTGFALRDGVTRTGNTVSMKYQSGDQTYTITQQPSDWNSQTLVENTLALNGSHKTLNVDGRTVYIYGGSNAVWVDGNIRYDVIGNATLSDQDITSIASSL